MRIQTTNTPAATFGRLGKIKVGVKKISAKNGKEYPSSTDHFVFTSPVPQRVAKIEALLMRVRENAEAGKIVVIPCTFPSDDEGNVCSQFYELRDTAGRVFAKGDGQTFFESGPEGYILRTPEDPAKYMEGVSKLKGQPWKECLIVRVVVLGFDELGVWEFRTYGAQTTIPSIVATFDGIKALAGRVRGIPFRLTVEKQSSNRSDTERTYPVVSMFCDFSPEGLESIRSLGGQLTGIITPAKLEAAAVDVAALPPGRQADLFADPEEVPPQAEDAQIEPFSPQEVAQQYLDNLILRTPQDYTEAALGIRSNKLLSKEEKIAVATLLGEEAKEQGYKWDPIANEYYKPK